MPPLAPHIGTVVGVRSEEQVIRIGARRSVAPMQNVKSVRDGASVQRPRITMDAVIFSVAREKSVAVAIDGTSPDPTSREGNREKPLLDRGGIRHW